MKTRLFTILTAVVVLSMVVSACAPKATPTPTKAPVEVKPTAKPIKIVVIGKSVHPYWSNVEKGTVAAAKDLGVEAVFFVPPKEDVAAQIQTMETYIAQGVTGIAVAPSDPNALEPVMKKAADAGIFVTTLDTPPIDGSVSLVYIGTNNYSAGKTAGETMAKLLPGGGKVGIGRGSDTALNALQRTDGFLEGIKGTAIEALEPVNDKEDAATALSLANSVISANPDLAGAFGVYAYNGPAWATAIKEANAVGKIKLVSFDATTDIINGIKEGVIDATVAQREYDMGYKSVGIIKLMAEKGVDAALSEMDAVEGIIDTGVDVITAATLKDYEAGLDTKGIPHEWTTAGWEPTEVAPVKPIKIAVIGKSVHPYWSNVEKGTVAAAKDLGVEAVFFVPPKEDVAAQIQTMETYIAQGVTGIAIAPSDPNALEPVMKKAADAGIFVTTLDTPPIDGSVSLVYIGTNNYSAGKTAGETMAELLPGGGKVGIGRGSDTALNALQRTDGFLEGIKGTAIEALEPVNDKEDAATALQLANSVISGNPDLAGAFGVYAYNGPAWATAIKEANAVGKIKLVSFDATTDIINGIKEGVIDATIAQREYDMGYKSVGIIKLMAEKGVDAALSEMGAVEGIIDTGVDVITAATLKDYEAGLDKKGIPHEWDTAGWEPAAAVEPCAPATEGPLAGVDPRGQTVVWWHQHSAHREEWLNEMAAEFNATNECSITLVPEFQGGYNDIRDKMNAGIATGELPGLTVGYQNDQAFYALADGLADMNLYIDDPTWGLTAEEKADFYPAFLEQGVHPAFGGARLGFPPNRSMEMIFYNNTWGEELGFDAPPTTPDEFREIACAAAEANADGTGGFILRDDASAVAAWTFAFGGNVLTEDGTGYVYDGQATIDAMTFLKGVYDDGCAYFFTEGYPNPELAARRAIFTMGSSSGIPYYASDMEAIGSTDVWSAIAVPHTTADPVQNIYGGDIMIPATTPEIQLAAWMVIKWLTTPEMQAEWDKTSGYFPTRASTAELLTDYVDENPKWGQALALLPYGTYEPQLISYQSVRDAAQQAFNEMMQGADIKATLDALTEEANELQAELMEE